MWALILKMNKYLKISLLLLLALSITPKSYATQNPIQLKAETNTVNMEMVVKDNFIKAKYASAGNRL